MKFLNRSDLAREFKISLGSVDSWVRRGCPASKKGNQWRFNLEEVAKWRNREQGFQTTRELPENITGNALRDFFTMGIQHYLWWLTHEMGPAFTGLLNEKKIDHDLIKTLFIETYGIMCFCTNQYIAHDEFNKMLKKTGEDFDSMWNVICGSSLKVIKTFPPKKLEFLVPEIIKAIHQDLSTNKKHTVKGK